MAKTLRQPRGAKSTEHLKILRQSDPCYGSLAPSRDRPSRHEHTTDPLARYNAMAKTMQQLRGAKSTEHLKILRQSDPCYGSLAPSRDRPSCHEHTYDPLARYNAMARTIREPSGYSSRAAVPRDRLDLNAYTRSASGASGATAFEHLAHVRQSFQSRPNANPNFDDAWQAGLPESSAIRAVSSISSDIWRRFEDDDQLPDLPSQGWLGARRGPHAHRQSSDEISDMGSERSAGRTMERASNDTALSLADMDDIINNKARFETGEWGSVPNSPIGEPSAGATWIKLEKAKSLHLFSAPAHASSSQPLK
jgi:hypothetical protein